MIDFDDTAFDLTAMSALKADNVKAEQIDADATLDDILKELTLGNLLDDVKGDDDDDWSMPTLGPSLEPTMYTFDSFLEAPVSKNDKTDSVVERIKRQRIIIEQQTDLVCIILYILTQNVCR